jgi:hypothetical protein
MTEAIAGAPAGVAPLALVLRSYEAAVPLLVANRPLAERRAKVIAATPALRERAHAKTDALLDAVVQGLTARGVVDETARLAAQIGRAVFDRASRAWSEDPGRDLAALIAQAAAEARALG